MGKGQKKHSRSGKARHGRGWSMFDDFYNKASNEFANPQSDLRGRYLPAAWNEVSNPQSLLRGTYIPTIGRYAEMGMKTYEKLKKDRPALGDNPRLAWYKKGVDYGLYIQKVNDLIEKAQAGDGDAQYDLLLLGIDYMTPKPKPPTDDFFELPENDFANIDTDLFGSGRRVHRMHAYKGRKGKRTAGRGWFEVPGAAEFASKVSNEFTNPESDFRTGLGKTYNEFANPDSVLRSSGGDAAVHEIVDPDSLLRGTYIPEAGKLGKKAEMYTNAIARPAIWMTSGNPQLQAAIGTAAIVVIAAARGAQEIAYWNDVIGRAQKGEMDAAVELLAAAARFGDGENVSKFHQGGGMGGAGRRSNPKAKERGAKIKAIMRERGVSLPEASRILARGG